MLGNSTFLGEEAAIKAVFALAHEEVSDAVVVVQSGVFLEQQIALLLEHPQWFGGEICVGFWWDVDIGVWRTIAATVAVELSTDEHVAGDWVLFQFCIKEC